jgi:hypothetical protein
MRFLTPDFITRFSCAVLANNAVRSQDYDSGTFFEEAFAHAIDATHKRTVSGLEDIVSDGFAYTAKTVKLSSPFTVSLARLISGRISLELQNISDTRNKDPQFVGSVVLTEWNKRVADVESKYEGVSTIVLIRNDTLTELVLFETPTKQYSTTCVRWYWNKKKDLVAQNEHGTSMFTWQPSGGQFTIHQPVPTNSLHLVLPDVPKLSQEDILRQINFNPEWITVKQMPHDTMIRSSLFKPLVPAQI